MPLPRAGIGPIRTLQWFLGLASLARLVTGRATPVGVDRVDTREVHLNQAENALATGRLRGERGPPQAQSVANVYS